MLLGLETFSYHPFRRLERQGAGAKLGKGTFKVYPPPYDPSFMAPSVAFRPPEVDQGMPGWQNLAVESRVAFVRELNRA
ncbi:MAG: hypothetical protein O3B73_16460 [bacterium]|jgi:hypothetical protein|nr:hypothetical protein [bacterium]